MSDQGATVQFGGDATGAVQASQKAAAAVKASVEGMKASMEKLQGQFGMVTAGFAAITAAVAGGSALRGFVNEANEVTKSAVGMGKALGISATDASTFKVALEEAGVSSDAVAMAGKRVTMALAQGGEKFAALGVKTKDANGQFRNSRDIMLDVNEKLRGFKEGTDRNIEAIKIYSRSYADLMPFIQKFKGETEESRKLAADLNLVVGQESVDASRKYNESKRGMDLVMKGVERTIGEALIPRLTAMANFFKSEGPAAVSVMRGIMNTYLTIQDAVADGIGTLVDVARDCFKAVGKAITDVFGTSTSSMTGMQFFANVLTVIKVAIISFRIGAQEAFAIVGTALEVLIDGVKTWADVGMKAFSGDLTGAVGAFKAGIDRRSEILAAGVQRMIGIATKGAEDLKTALDTDPTAAKKVTAATTPGGDGKDARVKGKPTGAFAPVKAALEAELAIRKEVAAEALRFMEDQHQKELTSDREFYAAKVALEQNALDGEAGAKQAELANARMEMRKVERGDVAKLNGLKAQAVKLESELTVIGLKRLDAAVAGERALATAEETRNKKFADERLTANAKMVELEISSREEQLRVAKEMGALTVEEELSQQRVLIAMKYAADRSATEARLALAKHDVVERAKLNDELLAMDKAYQAKLTKNSNDAAIASALPWKSFMASVQASVTQGLDSMFDRTKTFGEKMKAVWVSIATAFVQMETKKLAAAIVGEEGKTAATVAGATERTAVEWWAAAQGVAATAWAAIKTIAIKAWEAAASVYAAIAGIPYVGPFLAPVMAMAAMGVVGGMVSHIASAEGGYDIPSGVNPMTQLHEREMVLPAKQADVIRNMADGGGAGGGSMSVNINAHPMPGNYFMVHRSQLVTALKSAARDNVLRPGDLR